MSIAIIIPARYGSSRYEGKPLIKINKIPLVIRVAIKCSKAIEKKNVFVATDDSRIAKVVENNGFNYIMTSKKCLTGTDRVAEASLKINSKIIINVQGDEPLINPSDIKKIIQAKKKFKNKVICAFTDLRDDENVNRRSIPKVVMNEKNELVYISRNPVPISKLRNKDKFINYYKQVCIYAFNKIELKKFVSFKRKSVLENIEDIEILRFYETNIGIKMIKVSNSAVAVDEPADKKKVERILNEKQS
ncbi:3-deoxy-manno-octulosonate cytidylyltransferase [Candidatus Pelagibacter sp.]|nr:3-deoxy-manno-octulosonate cytidylyltransferase [Candidatus Pelagibacter sp.]